MSLKIQHDDVPHEVYIKKCFIRDGIVIMMLWQYWRQGTEHVDPRFMNCNSTVYSIKSLLQSCQCSSHCRISITISTDSFLSWLLLWPLWSWRTGRINWCVGVTESSGTVGSCWMLWADGMAACSSFSETRHIGQVVCFCNHKSKQARWKLWRHGGMILRISFSLYSPKHMEHLLRQTTSKLVRHHC